MFSRNGKLINIKRGLAFLVNIVIIRQLNITSNVIEQFMTISTQFYSHQTVIMNKRNSYNYILVL